MPVKSFKDRAERVAAKNERVRLDALKVLRHILHAKANDPVQVEIDATKSKSEAPFYLFAATQIAASGLAKEAAKDDKTGTTLNVVIMGQAPSNEAWLEAVKQSQQKVIDATVAPVVAPEKKS